MDSRVLGSTDQNGTDTNAHDSLGLGFTRGQATLPASEGIPATENPSGDIPRPLTGPVHALTPSEEQILARAMRSARALKFGQLWMGKEPACELGLQEGDLAFCVELAFWYAKDPVAIDRLFRHSRRYRPRWDQAITEDGRAYGQAVVSQAISLQHTTYDPHFYKPAQSPAL